MVFDKSNAQRINSKEVYLHDDLFIEFRFERASNKAILLCLNRENGSYVITFHDVIGIEMTSCDFWGPSPHIDTFVFVDSRKQVLISKLQEEYRKYSTPDDLSFDSKYYIETVLYLISGDHFRVACKTIQIEYSVGTGNDS